MVISVHAPDSPKNFDEFEKSMQTLKKVVQEWR